jgi:hypothetical protein
LNSSAPKQVIRLPSPSRPRCWRGVLRKYRPLREASGETAIGPYASPAETPSDWKRPDLAHLFQLYKVCMARVMVRDANGDLANGAAFHIGDGYLVTARHVIEHGTVELVEPEQATPHSVTIARSFVPDDPRIDLAVLETDFSLEHFMHKTTIIEGHYERPKTDFIPLGGHLDDWIGDELLLSGVLAMGYPRIPLSSRTQLIASLGQVNGVIDRYDEPHVHFVISTLGRGGFSGGPVISEFGFLLGVATGLLVDDPDNPNAGLPAALSIEPLLNLLDENGIYPGENGRFLRDFYSVFEEPLEHLLASPNVTFQGDAEEAIRADRAERGRIAQKRAANPRYQPPSEPEPSPRVRDWIGRCMRRR